LQARRESPGIAGIGADDNNLKLHAGAYWHERHGCDLFFITLDKSEKDYSPTTMYDDYPISPTLFHWQSQSFTRPSQPILPACDEIHNS